MTHFQERDSGLILPQEKPKKPKRKYGVLEIQDEDKRELATKALWMLWEAMDLEKGDRWWWGHLEIAARRAAR